MTSKSPTYIVNFGLPNQVGVAGIMVTEFSELAGDFGAIIGMDIISLGDCALTHADGKTCFSFRIPACEEVDYVKAWQKQFKASVPRNAPCPCGSAKKFKNCHGA